MLFYPPVSKKNYWEQFSEYFNRFCWAFVCSFIHFFPSVFIECQPNSGTVLTAPGAGVKTAKKTDTSPCPFGACT